MLEIIWIIIMARWSVLSRSSSCRGRIRGGFFVTALLGMAGAVVATFLGRFLGLYGAGQGAGFIASIVGAILVLFVYRSVRKR